MLPQTKIITILTSCGVEKDTAERAAKELTAALKPEPIELRKKAFGTGLKPFVDKYGRELVLEFYNYWTEPNPPKTKMRFEMEKTWDLGRRIKRWADNKTIAKTESGNGEKKYDRL